MSQGELVGIVQRRRLRSRLLRCYSKIIEFIPHVSAIGYPRCGAGRASRMIIAWFGIRFYIQITDGRCRVTPAVNKFPYKVRKDERQVP
jgi:hypothetical protein